MCIYMYIYIFIAQLYICICTYIAQYKNKTGRKRILCDCQTINHTLAKNFLCKKKNRKKKLHTGKRTIIYWLERHVFTRCKKGENYCKVFYVYFSLDFTLKTNGELFTALGEKQTYVSF